MTDALLVFCTAPDTEIAEQIARQVVEQKLAACVNLLTDLHAIYRWQGNIVSDIEVQLVIKTQKNRYPELEARLKALHPYDTPEIIAIPITSGLPAYLTWIRESTS